MEIKIEPLPNSYNDVTEVLLPHVMKESSDLNPVPTEQNANQTKVTERPKLNRTQTLDSNIPGWLFLMMGVAVTSSSEKTIMQLAVTAIHVDKVQSYIE